jgi:hypothetical protein
MTADAGGGVGGAGGVFGGLAVLDPPLLFFGVADLAVLDEDVPDVLGPPALNGSLLSKSENDCS